MPLLYDKLFILLIWSTNFKHPKVSSTSTDCLWRGNLMFIHCDLLGKILFPNSKHMLIFATLWYIDFHWNIFYKSYKSIFWLFVIVWLVNKLRICIFQIGCLIRWAKISAWNYISVTCIPPLVAYIVHVVASLLVQLELTAILI